MISRVTAGLIASLLAACETAERERSYRARATDAAGLAEELLGAPDVLLPELIPWPCEAAGDARAMEDLGYRRVRLGARWPGRETASAWMLDAAEVGVLRSDADASPVAAALRRASVPWSLPRGQGAAVIVPGPSLRRAQAALRADAAAAPLVLFSRAERPAHVYRAAARSLPRLRDELERYRTVHGRLPDAVVGACFPGWMEAEMFDVRWRAEMGYDLAQCAYRIEWGGRGEIGEAALMLRERTVACLMDGRVLPECVAALGGAAIPVYVWMSQTFYLSVPERRYEQARRVLRDLERRLGASLGVYPARG